MTLTITEIHDQQTWNSTLAQMDYSHILQTWEWGQFKYETTGWIPHRWVIRHEDQIIALCSMGERKIGPFSFMYAPKGPALNENSIDHIEELLQLFQSRAKKHRAIWLKIDPDLAYATGVPGEEDYEDQIVEPGDTIKNLLNSMNWRFSKDQIQFRNTITIDLNQQADQLLSAMSGNTRRKVRQAEKKNVTVRDGTLGDLDLLYRLYATTGERNGFLLRPREYYLKLWRYFMENDLAHPLIAEYEGKAIAHVILFHFGKTCWYFYGASSNEERDRMPTYALQWEAMKWAKQRGYKVYDMWGAPNEFTEDDPMWGVYMFKQGFRGTVERHIGAWDYVPYSLLDHLYSTAWPKIQGWMRNRSSSS